MSPLASQLAALAAQGRTAKQAGAVVGIERQRAYDIAKHWGFRFAPARKKMDLNAALVGLREVAGEMTLVEAARHLGLYTTQVQRLAKQHSIVFSARGDRTTARVRAAAEAGMSPLEISRLVGMDRSNLYRIARKAGFKFKPRLDERAIERARRAADPEAYRAEQRAKWREKWAKRHGKVAPAPQPVSAVAIMQMFAARENAAMRRRA